MSPGELCCVVVDGNNRKMTTKKELLEVLELCRKALESCTDNFGSESCDNGCYEAYHNDKLISEALNRIYTL